jgi:DNA-binding MarR family transcriptional regulator
MTVENKGFEDPQASGYWYAEESRGQRSVEVLNAMRAYRAAEADMRKRTRSSMGMGDTDMLAIRFLLESQSAGVVVSPKDLAARLGITTASTTILLDRLTKSGHVERQPHPTDGRARIIVATGHTDTEVRSTLNDMHARMMEVADDLSPDEAATIVSFLTKMRGAVHE